MRVALRKVHRWMLQRVPRGTIPADPLTILLSCAIGVLGGYGAVLFNYLIRVVTNSTVRPIINSEVDNRAWLAVLWVTPALGLLVVAWLTRRFAPEAQGHGVPEVITAVARHGGVIRPRVSLVKIVASGLCIGTGGSVGRKGPIVQIGSALGSMAGQLFKLSARHTKVLVAAGAAAGISATFHASLAGVMFASEIILGNFAIESLTPIVITSVLADVVHAQWGEHGWNPAFTELNFTYLGVWEQMPSYVLLGLACGLAAVIFTKLLYRVEDDAARFSAEVVDAGPCLRTDGGGDGGGVPQNTAASVRCCGEGDRNRWPAPSAPPRFGLRSGRSRLAPGKRIETEQHQLGSDFYGARTKACAARCKGDARRAMVALTPGISQADHDKPFTGRRWLGGYFRALSLPRCYVGGMLRIGVQSFDTDLVRSSRCIRDCRNGRRCCGHDPRGLERDPDRL
jgi:hypothetical protein